MGTYACSFVTFVLGIFCLVFRKYLHCSLLNPSLPLSLSAHTIYSVTIIGVGVTEAGLASSDTSGMKHLYELLQFIYHHYYMSDSDDDKTDKQKICVIDMDNVPNNGTVIEQHMKELASSSEGGGDMAKFIQDHVVFLNTMVDRITSYRDDDTTNKMIPKCEPIPYKALVVLDEDNSNLPKSFYDASDLGLHIRSTTQQLDMDVSLKLRIANGTHTALAHVMALCSLLNTDELVKHKKRKQDGMDPHGTLLLKYIDSLYEYQIKPGACIQFGMENETEIDATYNDWRKRLTHEYFGLST